MEHDYRNRTGSRYDPQYRPPPTTSPSSTSTHHPMYGYPNIGQPSGHSFFPPPVGRPHQSSSPATSSPGIGIRVSLKPEYRITPPPQLSPQIGDIPRSNFQFDFEFERKVLAEAEKESPNWSKLVLESKPVLENHPPKAADTSPVGSTTDLVVRKYIASGLSKEAVPLAVANYGDNPTKVREFANGYTVLHEMGFSSNSVAEALLMFDNDTDKAVAYFLNSSS